MERSLTQARDLDHFIQYQLLPDTIVCWMIDMFVQKICSFLKRRCFRDAPHRVRVSKVVKGGSSYQGTTLRGCYDADLVVFLSEIRSFQEQLAFRGAFIQEIKRQLEAFLRGRHLPFEIHEPRWEQPCALSLTFWSLLNTKMELHVLPAFDVLGQWAGGPEPHIDDEGYRPDPQIYVRLIEECRRLGKEGEFSPCFTELQQAFLRPTELKSLILLVKHWYQLCRRRLGEPLPTQYALELLTVRAWERGCRETHFSTAQGFRSVLELVVHYRQLCVYWTKYYDFANPVIHQYVKTQLQQPRPVILDPADPTGNVADGGGWQRLAQEAADWLRYPCWKNWDESPVGSRDTGLQRERGDSSTCTTDDDAQASEYHTKALPQEDKSWTCAIL